MMIGIDLGTTHSLIAHWNGTAPELIPNALGRTLTPSVVGIDDNGTVLVGEAARERLITHPDLTAACFKRRMGSDAPYKLGAKSFRPEELSALVLRSLRDDAEALLGAPVTEAVISVPAYFNATQRRATEAAAELARLKVTALISEPTAAALAYGIEQANAEEKFLVLDLGGGTFDVTLLEKFEGVIEVRASAGDNFLGGEDFLEAISHHVLSKHSLSVPDLDRGTLHALARASERAKCILSTAPHAELKIEVKDIQINETITREEFEKISESLIERLRRPIERAIRDARVNPSELSQIILVGGATRMPLVRSLVARLFHRFPNINLPPDEAIALGACIQAALAGRHEALKEVAFTDLTPYSLGIATCIEVAPGKLIYGQFSPIIERNTVVPVSRSSIFTTVDDNQREITIAVYQGESRTIENNIKLGEFSAHVPKAPRGQEQVEVRFTLDKSGILEVEVEVKSSGEKTALVIERNSGTMSAQEIQAALKKLSELKIHPRAQAENRLLLARAERLYEELRGEIRQVVAHQAAAFEAVVESQDLRAIEQARKQLAEFLQSIESTELS